MPLNNTQRDLLKAIVNATLESIHPDGPSANIKQCDYIIDGLKAIVDENKNKYREFIGKPDVDGIRDSIIQLYKIYIHPHSQNRSQGNPGVEYAFQSGEYGLLGQALLSRANLEHRTAYTTQTFLTENVVYTIGEGRDRQLAYEPKGLLGLTAKNDATASPPIAVDVRKVMEDLIELEVHKVTTIKQAIQIAQFEEEQIRSNHNAVPTADVYANANVPNISSQSVIATVPSPLPSFGSSIVIESKQSPSERRRIVGSIYNSPNVSEPENLLETNELYRLIEDSPRCNYSNLEMIKSELDKLDNDRIDARVVLTKAFETGNTMLILELSERFPDSNAVSGSTIANNFDIVRRNIIRNNLLVCGLGDGAPTSFDRGFKRLYATGDDMNFYFLPSRELVLEARRDDLASLIFTQCMENLGITCSKNIACSDNNPYPSNQIDPARAKATLRDIKDALAVIDTRKPIGYDLVNNIASALTTEGALSYDRKNFVGGKKLKNNRTRDDGTIQQLTTEQVVGRQNGTERLWADTVKKIVNNYLDLYPDFAIEQDAPVRDNDVGVLAHANNILRGRGASAQR